jgi:hypothetical protein
MDLVTWIPFTFALGLAGIAVCFAFVIACEKI